MHLHLHGSQVTMDRTPIHAGGDAVSVPPVSTRRDPASAPQARTAPGGEQNAAVTCARDGRSHVVPHAVLAESLTAGTGCCTAVCGHVVLPASLASPPGDRCALCAETAAPARRAPRRRAWLGSGRFRVAS